MLRAKVWGEINDLVALVCRAAACAAAERNVEMAPGSDQARLRDDAQAKRDGATERESQVQARGQRIHVAEEREVWNDDEICFCTMVSASDSGA
eukprot:7531057-Pyramimonas_sp.AAC.1